MGTCVDDREVRAMVREYEQQRMEEALVLSETRRRRREAELRQAGLMPHETPTA